MKIQTPGKLFFVGSILVALAGCATSSTRESAPVVSMGSSTYSVTRQASNGFTRDTEKLKAEAKEDAAKFCADHGKQMKIVAVTEDKPLYTLGYATAKVIFKALDAGDPELTAPTPALTMVERSAPSGDLYTELTKLDELRRRGILTDSEFESEKKKVLNRSK